MRADVAPGPDRGRWSRRRQPAPFGDELLLEDLARRVHAPHFVVRPDLTELVEQLVTKESVPFLPVLRYKESGLRNRADWERTLWKLPVSH